MTVYFIGAFVPDGADDPFSVKIGYTDSDDAENRKDALQRESGQAAVLSVLASVPGTRKLEKHLHDRFAEFRQRGEWFRYEGELRSTVDAVRRINKASNDIGRIGCLVAAGSLQISGGFKKALDAIEKTEQKSFSKRGSA
jgi:hypothetical protein